MEHVTIRSRRRPQAGLPYCGRAMPILHCRRRMRRLARSAAVTSRLVRSRLKASGSKRPPHQVKVSRCSG